jgi:hypothetical protein
VLLSDGLLAQRVSQICQVPLEVRSPDRSM